MKNIKKIISVFLTLAIIISAVSINGFTLFSAGNVWDGSVAEKFNSGSGTEQDPYIIMTAEELAYLSQQVDMGICYEDEFFELGADIILNDTTNWEQWGTYDEDNQLIAPVNSWSPVGRYSSCGFFGNFDGKGYTVYGVYVNNSSIDYFGLFGYVGEPNYYGHGEKRTIKNLNVSKSYIAGNTNSSNNTVYIGGIAGYGNAEGCAFNGRVSGKATYVGGVIGYGDAKYCSNYGTVTGENVGGVVSNGTTYYCNNYGDIYSYGNVGGVIAEGNAKYCSNSGDIYAYDPYMVGGVIGNAYAYSFEEMTQYCFNSGNITVEKAYYDIIGGVAGNGIVSDCYNSGNITLTLSEGENDVGGIVGSTNIYFDTSLSGCYNAGVINVDCSGKIGAVVGDNEDEIKIEDCYYLDSSYSSDNYSVALTHTQMLKANSFTHWNFNRMWEYIEGAEYPYPTLRCFGSKEYYYSALFVDGNGTVLKEVLAEDNQGITITEPVTQAGLEFCYWENNGARYNAMDTFVMTEDQVFYAVFERNNTYSKSWDGSVGTSFSGSGTEDDPYRITSAKELAYLAESVNGGNRYSGSYFSLTSDIYLNDAVDAYSYFTMAENKWIPIGKNSSAPFSGYFNGNGHTVYGLYISSGESKLGLFGYVHKGKIENLNINNSAVFSYQDNNEDSIDAGLVVGFCNGELKGCTTNGTVQLILNRYDYDSSYSSLRLGGVAGYSQSIVSDCVNNADVSFTSIGGKIGNFDGTLYFGGVLGRGENVENCINNGCVSSYGVTTYYNNSSVYLTGVVGRANVIKECTNNGKISAERFFLSTYESDNIDVAGISSYAEKEAVACINNGEVSAMEGAGGILLTAESNTVVEDCKNHGNIKGGAVGGIVVNSLGYLFDCENTGDLSLVNNFNYNGTVGGIAASGNNANGCTNRGNISVDGEYINGSYHIGGILGVLIESYNAGNIHTVSDCTNYGDISFESEKSLSDRVYIGGIVGIGYKNTLVENSFFNGDITITRFSGGDVGGIIGNGTVKNCLYEGNISVLCDSLNNDAFIGGITGSGTVDNSLALGNVTLESEKDFSDYHYDLFAGAMVGDTKATVNNSFYLNDPNAEEVYINSSGTKGSVQTLANKSTYKNWDFNKVWEMRDVALLSYPTLRCIGSKNYKYYLEYVDEGKTISKQLLNGGSSIDFSAAYQKQGYTFAYWEKDDIYYYPEDTKALNEDGVYTAVWVNKNKGKDVWNPEITDTEWSGSGTEADPYLVTSAEELAGLAQMVNNNYSNDYEGMFFKQTKDIYLNDIHGYSHTIMAENIWTPIGVSNTPFRGNYDGGGYTVYGIYIKSNDNYASPIRYGGLFGRVENSTIKNLTVDSSYLEHFGGKNEYANYGAFVGRAYYDCSVKFENCTNKASVNSNRYSGGFVGYVEGNLIINDCYNYGNVSAPIAGGFAGYIYNHMDEAEIIIKNSVNYGEVSDLEFNGHAIGGFVGEIYDYDVSMNDTTEFIGLENKGTITCRNGYAGGIAGDVEYIEKVESCVNNGEVTAKTGGGIFGYVSRYVALEKCVNNAKISASVTAGGIVGTGSSSYSLYVIEGENNADIKGGEYAAGIIGTGASGVYDSTNKGDITSDDCAGGITANAKSTIIGCENYGSIFASSYSGGIAGESSSYIGECANFGDVKSTDDYAGGIVGYCTWASYSTVIDCYNTGNILGDAYVGGIIGYDNSNGNGNISNCYNTGSVTGNRDVGGIAGNASPENCYNIGDIYGNTYVGGIAGNGAVNNCYNTGTVNGANDVGGITGGGGATSCYNIGDVYGKYYVGSICGDKYDSVTNCYYIDSIALVGSDNSSIYHNGTAVDSTTLASNTLSGFDFETVWTVGETENYIYPTLTGNVHEVTYKVTFLDADGEKVLKEQAVRKGWNAYPPTVEPFTDETYVYAIDHWDGEYKNVTKDTTVKAVYKKTEKIKFTGRTFNLSVPFGYSKDNLTAKIESEYRRVLAITTHGYKMNLETEFDLSDYVPNKSGEFIFTGKAVITESPYYEMANGESFTIKVTVDPALNNEFDVADLTFTETNDKITITGYNGLAEEIRIPETINGKSVIGIGENSFKDNKTITSVYLPDSVESIGDGAFENAVNLVTLSPGKNLRSIGANAFCNTSLAGITLYDNVETIGENAFGIYENAVIKQFTVYCLRDSVAEDYARENGLIVSYIEIQTNAMTGISATVCEGLALNASKVVGGDYYEAAQTITEKANVSLFEITLSSEDGYDVQPDNMMTVSIPLPDGYEKDSKIYRINADGSYLDMNAVFKDGKLVFSTAHLSYYAIVSEDDAIIGDANGDGNFDTTDLATLKLFLAGVSGEIAKEADLNGDGEINTTDLAEMKLMLAGAK